jgi:RNA methyltransferase, TrmH family
MLCHCLVVFTHGGNMEPNQLSSVQNPRVKQLVKLRDRSEREATDQFIIEGYRELLRAVDAGHAISSLFICPPLFLGSNEQFLIDRMREAGTQVFECTKPVFEKISYRDRPDGLVGVASQLHLTLNDFDRLLQARQQEAPFLVVAEAIEKPGNLGTILRSSDAVGLHGLIVCDRCTDIHNPNVVRASVGTLFTVPVAETKGEETLEWLKKNHIAIVAATPSAVREFTDVDLSGPIAIAVGTEQLGLSKRWMEAADIQVRIPMHGVADSLNVAMATTLLLYEALRQRQLKGQ